MFGKSRCESTIHFSFSVFYLNKHAGWSSSSSVEYKRKKYLLDYRRLVRYQYLSWLLSLRACWILVRMRGRFVSKITIVDCLYLRYQTNCGWMFTLLKSMVDLINVFLLVFNDIFILFQCSATVFNSRVVFVKFIFQCLCFSFVRIDNKM